MSVATIAQIASSVSNIALVIAIGVGYFLIIRINRAMLQEMYEDRIIGGRPQVIVDDIFDRLPEVDIAVRNISRGPAKDIRFEFAAPVESTDGVDLSQLSHFQDGIGFLSPGKEITVYWDELDNLIPFLQEKGLDGGISVITHYKDLANNSYSTTWDLNPCIYRDKRHIVRRGVGEVASHLGKISEEMDPERGGQSISYRNSHRVEGSQAPHQEENSHNSEPSKEGGQL
jgi:hypothetical protein